LPHLLETLLSGERKLQLLRLRALLSTLWDLDRASMSLANGIVVHTKKLLAARHGLSQEQVSEHQLTLQCLYSWLLHIEQGPNGGGVAGGVGVIVGAEAAAAAGAAAGDVHAGGAGGNVVVGIGGEGQGAQAAAVGAGGAAGAGAAAGRGVRGGGNAANAPAAAGARAPGGRAARGPAATARLHHMDRTTHEPVDPRCLRPNIKALGETVYRDILSFAIAVTIDPVVNPFKPRHCSALSQIADVLKAADGLSRMQELKRRVALAADAQPPADAAGAQPPPLSEAGAQQPPVQAAPAATTEAVVLLKESRLLYSFLVAISGPPVTFSTLATLAADVLLSARSTIEDYFQAREGTDGTAAMYQRRWGEQLTPAELRARFVADYPHASDDAAITGSWFPGLLACRPAAFAPAEEAELGTCAKNYEEAHKFFSPGTFTICCACEHPKMLGFVVMDKREGPPALLNALLSHFALLPLFVVYDFACGALRSAIGKLPFLIRFLVFISDLFHIVNHLCSDALHPRSYVPMDKANTVAHEQRNAPINLLRRTLRAVGQDEYMDVLKMKNVIYNIMAHAKSTCPYPLPDSYNYRQYYFSRAPCLCGCDYHPVAPPQPPPPPHVPEDLDTSEAGPPAWAGPDYVPLDV